MLEKKRKREEKKSLKNKHVQTGVRRRRRRGLFFIHPLLLVVFFSLNFLTSNFWAVTTGIGPFHHGAHHLISLGNRHASQCAPFTFLLLP